MCQHILIAYSMTMYLTKLSAHFNSDIDLGREHGIRQSAAPI